MNAIGLPQQFGRLERCGTGLADPLHTHGVQRDIGNGCSLPSLILGRFRHTSPCCGPAILLWE